jgi:leucyl-tRNA synthetase
LEDFDNEGKGKEIKGKFLNINCINPINKDIIPVYLTNFVLSEYGTGAVMISAFPDEVISKKEFKNFLNEKEIIQNREIDCEFANKLNIKKKKIYEVNKDEISLINSQLINKAKDKKEAIEIINSFLSRNKMGEKGEFYHLKD